MAGMGLFGKGLGVMLYFMMLTPENEKVFRVPPDVSG